MSTTLTNASTTSENQFESPLHRVRSTYDHDAETITIVCSDPPLSALIENPVRPGSTSLDCMEVHEIAKGLLRTALIARGVLGDEAETGFTLDHWLAGKSRRELGTRSNLIPADNL